MLYVENADDASGKDQKIFDRKRDQLNTGDL